MRGFTLIEILLVIGVIAILAAIVIVAINPARQFADARDAQRASDAQTILDAIYQYASDNSGLFPGSLTTDDKEICRTGTPVDECDEDSYYNMSALTTSELYLVSIPIDPDCDNPSNNCSTLWGTGYFVNLTSGGRVRIVGQGENMTIDITR